MRVLVWLLVIALGLMGLGVMVVAGAATDAYILAIVGDWGAPNIATLVGRIIMFFIGAVLLVAAFRAR